jgi:hypothetical protein
MQRRYLLYLIDEKTPKPHRGTCRDGRQASPGVAPVHAPGAPVNRPVASDLGRESQYGRCGPRCVFGDRSPHRSRYGAGRSAIAGRGRYVEPRAARRQRISFPLGRGLPSIDIADGKSRVARCGSHSSALGTRQRAAVSGSEMATTPRYRPCDRHRSRRSWPSGLSLTPWVGPSGTASKRIPWNPRCPITRTSPASRRRSPRA